MCLANDTARLRDFAKALFDVSQTEQALPLSDDPNGPDPALSWAGRASAIVDGALACIFLLSEEGLADAKEVFSAAKTELSALQSARRIARLLRQSPMRIRLKQ
jgi:hypothetical protein